MMIMIIILRELVFENIVVSLWIEIKNELSLNGEEML
jgi:hypothetical protein